MKKLLSTSFVFLLLVFIAGCEAFEYNVFQTGKVEYDESITTSYNIKRLLNLNPKDTLHLVFLGDTQRYYDDLKDLVQVVNELPVVDAVFIAGDISDYGTGKEYKWINRELKKLKVPFLTVIGNHDCIANASQIYQEVYGPLNYSFTWNDIRFIMHNTNGREFYFNGSVPDLAWMNNHLKDSSNYSGCLFVCHVPPGNRDFDPLLEQPYAQMIRNSKNTILAVNGHNHLHGLAQLYNDGIWYLNTSSPKNRFFSYVKIFPNGSSTVKFENKFIAF